MKVKHFKYIMEVLILDSRRYETWWGSSQIISTFTPGVEEHGEGAHARVGSAPHAQRVQTDAGVWRTQNRQRDGGRRAV